MSSTEAPSSGGSSGRRILSRPKPLEENAPKTESKPILQKPPVTKDLKENGL